MVTRSGMFFASLPRVHEQVRGSADDPLMAFATAEATRVDAPLQQPLETIFESAGPVLHSSQTGWIIKTVIDNQQKLNCAFFVN